MKQVVRKMFNLLQILKMQSPIQLTRPYPLSLVFIFSIFLIKWLFGKPKTRNNCPPSPKKLPIIGNFHQLSQLTHRSLHNLAKKHGPVMLLHLGKLPMVVISSSEAAREVMKNNDLIFADRPTSEVTKKLMYDNKDVAIAPYGEYWRQIKSIYTLQLLSNKRVESFSSLREEEIALMMNKIKDLASSSSPINLSKFFTDVTNDVVSRAAFGRKYGDGESGHKFKQLLRDYLSLLSRPDWGTMFPWLGWINRVNGFSSEVERVAREIDEFLEGVIQERVNSVKKSDEKTNDFLDILLSIHKDGGSGVSINRDSIKAMILTTFAAGTDTSSTFLEWHMTELLRNPTVMEKVQNEVREVLKGKSNINKGDLERMHYLKSTIKETFRLHPPIPLLVARKSREGVKIMGYDIDIGTTVVINACAIGLDPNVWDEPEVFKPERFLDSSIEYKGTDFELIPFGSGRRGCPGISFATAVNELVIANLVQNFDWDLPNGMKGEDLDVSECPGAIIHKRFSLTALAKPI